MRYDAYRHLISGIYGHLFERRFQFLAGDQPSATTFSNWALQDAFAIDAIESIIGDLRGASKEGGGSNLGSIYFTNLSRAIGNLALLSGWMPSMTDSGTGLPKTFWVVEPVPSGYNEISLSFYGVVMDPSMVPVFGYMDGETFTPYPSGTWVYQEDREDLKLANEFTLNGNKLIFKDHSPIPTPPAVQNAIRYYGMALSPFELEGKDGCLIPSLAQCIISHPVTGSNIPDMLCKVTEGAVVSGYQEYTLEIPEIRHLLYRSDFSQYASDISFVLTRGQKYKIFPIPQQTVSLRYPLPKWLTSVVRDVDDFAQVEGTQNIVAGNLLPTGTILLWNILTDEPAAYIGESDTFDKSEIQFAYIDETHLKVRIPAASKLIKKIENGVISYITTGDASTFALVVKGTDLAKEVFDIKTTLMFKPEFLNFLAYYPHSGIGRSFRFADASSPGEVGSTYHKYYQSVDEANFHPQYLEKGGYVQGSDPLNRDGAFLGDYCLALDGDTYPRLDTLSPLHFTALGPQVGSYNALQKGTYRFYWGSKDRLFTQLREVYNRDIQGTSLDSYDYLHNGSESTGADGGSHQRFDWQNWTKGSTTGRVWVTEIGEAKGRTDYSDDSEAYFSVWGVPYAVAALSDFAHLGGLRYPKAGGLLAKVFAFTDGNTLPRNAQIVSGGLRWFNQGDSNLADEEGGGLYAPIKIGTASKGAWGFVGVRRKTANEFLDQFEPSTFLAASLMTGVPYYTGFIYGARKSTVITGFVPADAELEALTYQALYAKSKNTTGAITFGSVLYPQVNAGSQPQYGPFKVPYYKLDSGNYYAKSKIFGILAMDFNPEVDYTTTPENLYRFGEIQMPGFWAVRGAMLGASIVRDGTWREKGVGSPAFGVGEDPLYDSAGTLRDHFSDRYSFGEFNSTGADWAIATHSTNKFLNGRFDTKGSIITKRAIKARFMAGEASYVNRVGFPNSNTEDKGPTHYDAGRLLQTITKETVAYFPIETDVAQTTYYLAPAYSLVPNDWPGHTSCRWLPISIQVTWIQNGQTNVYIRDDELVGGSGFPNAITQSEQFTVTGALQNISHPNDLYRAGDSVQISFPCGIALPQRDDDGTVSLAAWANPWQHVFDVRRNPGLWEAVVFIRWVLVTDVELNTEGFSGM